jgi:hypothetical protein
MQIRVRVHVCDTHANRAPRAIPFAGMLTAAVY